MELHRQENDDLLGGEGGKRERGGTPEPLSVVFYKFLSKKERGPERGCVGSIFLEYQMTIL